MNGFISELQNYQEKYGNYHVKIISYRGGTQKQGGGNVFSLINDEGKEEQIIVANVLAEPNLL